MSAFEVHTLTTTRTVHHIAARAEAYDLIMGALRASRPRTPRICKDSTHHRIGTARIPSPDPLATVDGVEAVVIAEDLRGLAPDRLPRREPRCLREIVVGAAKGTENAPLYSRGA